MTSSFTPLASHDSLSPILKSFVITPWFYKGWIASNFATAAINPVNEGLQRDRWGVFAGIKERRIIAGLEFAQRMDEAIAKGHGHEDLGAIAADVVR